MQTRHVHRILYVSTVSWVNLTITILPDPARKPHILLLYWVTQMYTTNYRCTIYLSCYAIRESYATQKEKVMQEKVFVGAYRFYLSHCTYLVSQSIFEDFFLRVMGMLYLLCCAINMYSVNPGGQKAQG
jgi:hypothetical protein